MYREEVFEDMKSNGRFENIYISGPSGIINQNLQKISRK